MLEAVQTWSGLVLMSVGGSLVVAATLILTRRRPKAPAPRVDLVVADPQPSQVAPMASLELIDRRCEELGARIEELRIALEAAHSRNALRRPTSPADEAIGLRELAGRA